MCLFHSVADVNVLGAFSRAPGVPERFANATDENWAQALDDAARVGLLTGLGGAIYRIHPALPGYLADSWRREEAGNYDQVQDMAIRALLSAHATYALWLFEEISSGYAGLAYKVIEVERHTLGSLLGYALDHELWNDARAIAQLLDSYWDTRGLEGEARAWTDRARLALEGIDGSPPELDTPAGGLWMFFSTSQAAREVEMRHLDDAERTYQRILASFQAQPESPSYRNGLVLTYHQLGLIAHERGQLDEAESWFRKSLTISEELGDQARAAVTNYHLGIAAFTRGQLDEAEKCYRKSLAIEEELGDQPGAADSYQELGNVALSRGRLDEAESWYRKSLTLNEEFGNKPRIAMTYYDLGLVAQNRGQLDQAEDWYRKSLTLNEELGGKPQMAASYHQLGRIAQDQGRLDEAEDWCRKSLAISEELGYMPGMAITLALLGLLAEGRGQPTQALEWTVRSVALFSEFPHPATGPAPSYLASLTLQLGIGALEQAWQHVIGGQLPPAIRSYIESSLATE